MARARTGHRVHNHAGFPVFEPQGPVQPRRSEPSPKMQDDASATEDPVSASTPKPAPAPGMNAADSSFDLSLRLLTALVMFALVGSVSLLAYRWIEQNRHDSEAVRVPASSSAPAPVARSPDQGPLHRDEVLMDPGRVFKCEEQGRVTFSDQACTGTAPAVRPGAPATTPAAAP